jgi:hypothetical protein
MCRRLRAEGSSSVRAVRENCHQAPSIRERRPWFSMADLSFWLIALTSAAVVSGS